MERCDKREKDKRVNKNSMDMESILHQGAVHISADAEVWQTLST